MEKSKDTLYDNIAHVFYDFYFGNGVRHNNKPDKHFAQGDIVTTNCGWDLGIVDYTTNGKLTIFARDTEYGMNPYGIAFVDWYKTGISATLDEWVELSKIYKEALKTYNHRPTKEEHLEELKWK